MDQTCYIDGAGGERIDRAVVGYRIKPDPGIVSLKVILASNFFLSQKSFIVYNSWKNVDSTSLTHAEVNRPGIFRSNSAYS